MYLHVPIIRFQAVTAKGTFTSTIIGDGQTELFNIQSTMHRLVRIRGNLILLLFFFFVDYFLQKGNAAFFRY